MESKMNARGQVTIPKEIRGRYGLKRGHRVTSLIGADGRVQMFPKTDASKFRSIVRPKGPKPWMRHVGKLKHLRKDIERVNRIIEEAFE